MKHCAGKMTLHFLGALTKPCDLNVSAMSMIKCKIPFTFSSCKISCTVQLVCHVTEDTALKSCYGDRTNEKGVGPRGWGPVNFQVLRPERLQVERMRQLIFL